MGRRLALAALCLLPVAGCWSRIEVNDLAIVSSLGIDRADGGNLQVWVQVINPARAGAAPGAGAGIGNGRQAPVATYTASGRTLLEATKNAQLEIPRRIFWAHMRVVVIGERLAREGVRPVIDALTRQREFRLTDYVFVIRGSPGDYMQTLVDLERVPAEHVAEIARSRIGIAVQMADFARMLASRGADPVAGVLEVAPPPPDSPPGQLGRIRLAGTALFQEDRLVGFMDEHVTRGLLWLRGETQRGVITVPAPKGPGWVSVEWHFSRVRREAWLEGRRIVLYVGATVEADLSDHTGVLDISDPKVIAQIEALVQQDVQSRMAAALQQMWELNVDAAGFGDLVRQRLPAVWRQRRLEEHWLREEFRRADVILEVQAMVRRTGMSSKPRGVPERMLIKGER